MKAFLPSAGTTTTTTYAVFQLVTVVYTSQFHVHTFKVVTLAAQYLGVMECSG